MVRNVIDLCLLCETSSLMVFGFFRGRILNKTKVVSRGFSRLLGATSGSGQLPGLSGPDVPSHCFLLSGRALMLCIRSRYRKFFQCDNRVSDTMLKFKTPSNHSTKFSIAKVICFLARLAWRAVTHTANRHLSDCHLCASMRTCHAESVPK